MDMGFPGEYEATVYPGYFWNVKTSQLYSIKSGWLKPLKIQSGWFQGKMFPGSYYQISIKGQRRTIALSTLTKFHPKETGRQLEMFPIDKIESINKTE